MAITVKKVSDKTFRVGNKVVYEDMEGNLVAVSELTVRETEALHNFLPKNYPKTQVK